MNPLLVLGLVALVAAAVAVLVVKFLPNSSLSKRLEALEAKAVSTGKADVAKVETVVKTDEAKVEAVAKKL